MFTISVDQVTMIKSGFRSAEDGKKLIGIDMLDVVLIFEYSYLNFGHLATTGSPGIIVQVKSNPVIGTSVLFIVNSGNILVIVDYKSNIWIFKYSEHTDVSCRGND